MKFKIIIGIVSSLLLIWAFGTMVSAQAETSSNYTSLQNPFTWDDTVTIQNGMELYQLSCQGCHGAFGNNLAVADFSTASYSEQVASRPGFFFWVISEGLPSTGMPSFKSTLTEEQRWQIITYLHTLGTGTAPPPTSSPIVQPQLEHGVLPDCYRCHTRVLVGHDTLGKGSAACLICHSSTTMGMLRLLSGDSVPASESPLLCGQCHPDRYSAWQTGTHGLLSRNSSSDTIGIPSNVKPKCVDCHEPHQPQLSLATGNTLPVVTNGENGKLDCLSCHVKVLKGHDQLGAGSAACWACHLSTEMNTFHLAGGETTRLSASESTKLCSQCHQDRYKAWTQGTHGVPAWKEGEPAIFGSEKVPCVNCHEPHQPQVRLVNITKPHPEPTPIPPKPPLEVLAILGISVVVAAGVGVIVMRGES